MTNDLSLIKVRVNALFLKKQKIHIDLSQKNKNKNLSHLTAEITGVYPNVFTVKAVKNGRETDYNFQYTDLLIHNVEIEELG